MNNIEKLRIKNLIAQNGEIINSYDHSVGLDDIPYYSVKYNDNGVYKYANLSQMTYNKLIVSVTPTIKKTKFNNKISKISNINFQDIEDKVINRKEYKSNNFVGFNVWYNYYALTESTSKHISNYVHHFLQKMNTHFEKMFPQGFTLKLKLVMSDLENKIWSSIVFDINDAIDNIIQRMAHKTNKHYDAINYFLYMRQISILCSPLSSIGGCCDRTHSEKLYEKKWASKTKQEKVFETIKIKSYKSKNNNCLLQCFNQFYNVDGNKIKPDTVRNEMKIEKGTKISYEMIPSITEYYNNKLNLNHGYIVINQHNTIILSGGNQDKFIPICIKDEHYYIFEIITHFCCPKCGRYLNLNNITHVCNVERCSYKNNIIDEKRDIVKVRNIKDKCKIDYNQIVPWDLETFQPYNKQVAYASGYKLNGKYNYHYGESCMDDTIKDFISFENKTITAYNGSGFDFYFLIDQLTLHNVKVENLILNNGKVMSFEFSTEGKQKNKVFDLYLFLMTSLDKACKDFKVKNSKSSFDHTLIKSWADTHTHKQTVLPYLKLDVLALEELLISFNDMMYEKFQVNITKFVTASNMAYELWASMLKNIIEIPKDISKYNLIKQATYGGRCYPNQKKFTSQSWGKIKQKVESNQYTTQEAYQKLMKSKDFIFNADATSLYPASMKGFELCPVQYPIGYSRWSEEGQLEFDNMKMGFYTIKFSCPKNIIPILPRRKLHNGVSIGVSWSLENGEGVYTSVDIENAIENGYKVDFVGKCLVYDESGDVFSDYIDTFYKLKEEAEKNSNPVMRSVAKLFLNALYGKTLQRAIYTKTIIINDILEFNNFCLNNTLTDWNFLGSGKVLITGEVKDHVMQIRKPCQLGAFVTAYSRRIMLVYMKAIDPTLQSMMFTYSDTDSMHIMGDAYLKLKEIGYIKNKCDSKLGYLTSDIDNNGIIFAETNLAPKSYMYQSIDELGKIKDSNNSTMKMKGIPHKKLHYSYYENEKPVVLEINGLKKKNKSLTKEDVINGVSHFNIINYNQDRTFYKNEWSSDRFINNRWYPLGDYRLNC